MTFVNFVIMQMRLTISWWMGNWWYINSRTNTPWCQLKLSRWHVLFSLGLPICTLHLVAAVGWWQLPDQSCLTRGSPRPSLGAKLLGAESYLKFVNIMIMQMRLAISWWMGEWWYINRGTNTPWSGLKLLHRQVLFLLGLPICRLHYQKIFFF